jgi:aminopeptidase N
MPQNDTAWYLINPGHRFFYRVQYDRQNMNNINRQLLENHERFDVETRAGLIEDTFTLARSVPS